MPTIAPQTRRMIDALTAIGADRSTFSVSCRKDSAGQYGGARVTITRPRTHKIVAQNADALIARGFSVTVYQSASGEVQIADLIEAARPALQILRVNSNGRYAPVKP